MKLSSQAGKKIIIAAHGNSLRGVVKHLDNMSDEDIMGLNLPTGIPFVYELDENMKPLVSMKFLGDEETVRKAIESVAAQAWRWFSIEYWVSVAKSHQKLRVMFDVSTPPFTFSHTWEFLGWD